jgi:acyl-CoA synthetase (AMP-forming)/AMP-acid ligase II
LPERATTFGALIRLGARRSPTLTAIKQRGGRVVSYAELDDRTDRLANALLASGLDPGDRVAAWMEDIVEYVELYVAVAKAGLVIVPINARLTPAEATYHLADSSARAIVWSAGLTGGVADLDAELMRGMARISTDPDADAQGFEQLVSAGHGPPPPEPPPDALFIIGYTSGTTGRPKGAMLTHRSVVALAGLNAISYRLPMYSVAALTGSMSFVAVVPAHIGCHFYLGGTIVIMGLWDVDGLIDCIEAERATFTYIPSPLIPDFTEAARRRPDAWAHLLTILHSASKADSAKVRALCEVVGDRFVEGLGMTENSGGLITATSPEDIVGPTDAVDPFASVGRAVCESAVRIDGVNGEAVARDGSEVGEIVITSPALMEGYWNRPEESAQALRDGWYHTGDLGWMDPAGYVYVSERRTDLIVTGGMNVYPSEVEQCIAARPDVAEVAVVGVAHERWGQTVAAAVVRVPGGDVSAEAIVDHCRRNLAGYKKPTKVVFVDALPKTTSLKVKRVEIRELLA